MRIEEKCLDGESREMRREIFLRAFVLRTMKLEFPIGIAETGEPSVRAAVVVRKEKHAVGAVKAYGLFKFAAHEISVGLHLGGGENFPAPGDRRKIKSINGNSKRIERLRKDSVETSIETCD